MSQPVEVRIRTLGNPSNLALGELWSLLERVGVSLPNQAPCRSLDEILAFADGLSSPVTLKLVAEGLDHKSDSGAVMIGLRSSSDIEIAFEELNSLAKRLDLESPLYLAQETIPTSEVEVLVGLRRDPAFGHMVVVGPGGRLVELIGSIAIRRCPVDASEARRMILETRLQPFVEGFRGSSRLDVAALSEIVERVSSLPDTRPDLLELDLNPLMPSRQYGGFVAVDARASLAPPPTRPARQRPRFDAGSLFTASSIAVVGASRTRPEMPANRVIRYLSHHGYDGEIYVVHPEAPEVEGVTAYPALANIPRSPDLICIAVPAAESLGVMRAAAERGVRSAIVFSSGFAESGEADLEKQLGIIAYESNIVFCGPNTIGLVSPVNGLYASFTQALETREPIDGDVALITQSGALGGSLLSHVWGRGIGTSYFVHVGNQQQLTVSDFLDFLVEDPHTRVVGLLLEGVEDGLALLSSLTRMLGMGKQVAVLKVGTSRTGAEAVRSHTGALAGDDATFRQALREVGVICVETSSDLVDVISVLRMDRLPQGRRLGILSTSGGACALVADACARHGLDVPKFSEQLQVDLAQVLPSFSTTDNPVDVTGHVVAKPEMLREALQRVVAAGEVDSILIALTTIADPQATDIAVDIVDAVRLAALPCLVTWTIDRSLNSDALRILRESGVPCFEDPEDAVKSLSSLVAVSSPEPRSESKT